MNGRRSEAPALLDYEPGGLSYLPRRKAVRRVTAGDAFRAGFFGGLGWWCAGVVIWVGCLLLGCLLVLLLGGLGAIVAALQ